jgi:elongator complex protein 2
LWNIERRQKFLKNTAEDLVDEILDNFEASLGNLGENEEGGRQISLKHHILTVKDSPERS